MCMDVCACGVCVWVNMCVCGVFVFICVYSALCVKLYCVRVFVCVWMCLFVCGCMCLCKYVWVCGFCVG